MFFDWKIQLEKVQLTRDLKDDTIIYQGIGLPCKKDQKHCNSTTRTQAIINCLVPRRHLYLISSSKNTRQNDKFSPKVFY